jgi:hypothetical protein
MPAPPVPSLPVMVSIEKIIHFCKASAFAVTISPPSSKKEIFLFQNYLEWINRIFFQREAAHRHFF